MVDMPPRAWTGRAVAQARTHMATTTTWPTPCGQQCGELVNLTDRWVVGHIKSRATHPELMWQPSNWRIEHRKCSDRTGQSVVIEKAKRDALASAGVESRVFSHGDAARQPPPLFSSLSPRPSDGLSWDPGYLAGFDWLQALLDVPEDASAPLQMSPIPDDAVGTYGWDAIEWIESTQRITLRWWQRLSLVRQLEHRADGSLCFRTKIESAPRRAGKSVGLRGGALWRMEHGERLFGEVPTIIHTGNDLAIVREIQRGAWHWSESMDWQIFKANGKESIEAPSGARWLARAQDSVYGYDVMLGMVDEAWNVKPDTITEGLEPAMLERKSPQLVITSTAHRRATSLMRTMLADAATGNDPETLLLLWAAPEDADSSDPAVWKAASPFWSEDRHKMIAAKHAKALAGEKDPEFDDLDPMAGFEAQYLNRWRLAEPRQVGDPVVSAEGWDRLTGTIRTSEPLSVAVEASFDAGVSVAVVRSGPVPGLSVAPYPDLPAAISGVKSLNFTGKVHVGASLTEHPGWKKAGVRVEKSTGAARVLVSDLARLIAEDAFKHDGGAVLTEQVLALRTSPGTDGPRLRSTERTDAVKAAVWAIQAARTVPVSSGVDELIYV